MSNAPSAEELESFRWGGVRARPRKKIAGETRRGETYLKPPGSLGSRWPSLGISLSIECCEGCSIFILDTTEQVQIAECVDCRVVVGPCVGSVFLLDCSRCTISVAAKQIRLRDMKDCELRIFAPTHECAVVETSSGLAFRSWDVAYPGLTAQFAAARWDPSVNYWNRIYDFSPAQDGAPPTFSILPLEEQVSNRWCELSIAPQGLCSGSVEERCGSEASVPGCECPCAAADGTSYCAGSGVVAKHNPREDPTTEAPRPTVGDNLNVDGSFRLGAQPTAQISSTTASCGSSAPSASLFAEWISGFKRLVDPLLASAKSILGLGATSPAATTSSSTASTTCIMQ